MMLLVSFIWMIDNFCQIWELIYNFLITITVVTQIVASDANFFTLILHEILRIKLYNFTIVGIITVDLEIMELAFLCKFRTARSVTGTRV